MSVIGKTKKGPVIGSIILKNGNPSSARSWENDEPARRWANYYESGGIKNEEFYSYSEKSGE
ncbi:MAG: hypothetical protein HRT57_08565 [Crocinitomicaceae bacterium]|nr:hypothetical protein [Crocinitomicaceae bacterium]